MRGGVLRLQSLSLQGCQQDAQHPIYAKDGTICKLASIRQRLRIHATRVHQQPAYTAFFGKAACFASVLQDASARELH